MSEDSLHTATFTKINESGTQTKSHLTVLLNPLLNSLFNCPDPSSFPLKKIFNKINKKDSQKFALLVPPSHILYNFKDVHSNTKLYDLCHYDIPFMSAHIIQLDQKYKNLNPLIHSNEVKYDFETLNNLSLSVDFSKKSLYVTNDSHIDRKFKILKVTTLTNFNDYFPDKYYTTIFIDQPLVDPKRIIPCASYFIKNHSYSMGTTNNLTSNDQKINTLSQDISQHNRATFEKIVHSNQRWVQYFKETFEQFLSDISTTKNGNPINNLNALSNTFQTMVSNSITIAKEEILFKPIGPELPRVIQDYMEEKLYGAIWNELQTREGNEKSELSEVFYSLDYLSIDQLDTDLYATDFQKFKLSLIVKLEKNLKQAIEMFMNFKKTNTFFEKTKILTQTLQILSTPLEDLPIDADTLLSLLVLVINKTQTRNLRCHIQYLQNFYYSDDGSNPTKFGILGYSISTLEAVAFYLEDADNGKFLHLKQVQETKIKDLIEFIKDESKSKEILNLNEYRDVLNYRTEKGESILSLCVSNFKMNLVEQLLDNFQNDITLDDLLDDTNIEGDTLLLQTLKHGNHDVTALLVNIFLDNCTAYEIKTYLNKQNNSQRTVGHYLSDQSDLVEKIGKYINWSLKDVTGKTPLFTIFRSYDQLSYSEMIARALRVAMQSQNGFIYNDHTDPNGNTLLHIIKTDVKLLLDSKILININQKNKKDLTPLMVYLKYNRVENIRNILNDKRLNCLNQHDTKKYLTCYEYIRNPEILEIFTRYHIKNAPVFQHCICHSLRIYSNQTKNGLIQPCSLQISVFQEEGKLFNISLNIKVLKNILKLILKKKPLTFVPIEGVLTQINSLLNMSTDNWMINNLTAFHRLQNREQLLVNMTNCLDTLIEIGYIPKHIFENDTNILLWIKQSKDDLSVTPKLEKIVDVEPEGINAIKHFLKFNLQELAKLKNIIYTLEKLLIFRNLKNEDCNISLDNIKYIAHDLDNHVIRKQFRIISDISKTEIVNDMNDISLNFTLANLEFYENSINVLYKNIEYLLDHQILKWWKNYGELLEVNRMLMKSMPQSSSNDMNLSEPNRNISESINSGVFGNFLEGQRIKNEQKLLRTCHDISLSMKKLGTEIAQSHELLAEELSNFMNFKEPFLQAGFVERNIKDNLYNLSENLLWMTKKYQVYESKFHKV
ncbi:similar to Saccharomyces cerevisiae YML002W Putative protein of unknown function [Maudiozyma saulgeensis]|uniref:VPS9 domain-containing protein n=1 Tax=Maudiozyma saulgeensis TaxID=1789683 RepID=A0A1X7RBV8_9SACH|nr:similar to Saccharomyces cerevisiae YML002W Putative protein of unknown function [Kazachstania saulgeensis]